jgi:hypothetical protein
MSLLKFVRVGRLWLNPRYITSIETEPVVKLLGGSANKTQVHIKLTTQQAEVSGNWMYFSGDQKRCRITRDFLSKKHADEWIQRKFGEWLS